MKVVLPLMQARAMIKSKRDREKLRLRALIARVQQKQDLLKKMRDSKIKENLPVP
jgi:hypothetical protein